MGNLVLAGATSGSTTITPSATGTYTITLPAETGTIQTSGAGFTTNGVAYATSTSALATGSALTFNGTNLGVGTSSPAQILSLYTNLGTGSGVGTSISIVADGSGGDQGYIGINKGSGNGLTFGEQNRDFIWQTGNTLPFNGTERMRLTSAGKLGIGTSSPTNGTLDVFSTTANSIQLSSDSTDAVGIRFNNTTTRNWNVGVWGSAGTVAGAWHIYDYTAGLVRFVINTSGIVTMSAYGVGTATFSSTGVISSVSDETWKIKDGVPVDTDAMLQKLEPGYWYYNDEKKETFGSDRQLGFYAQNVNSAIGPEAAPEPQEGKPWGYYDRSVLAVVVMSLQKALATIKTLENRITALEGK